MLAKDIMSRPTNCAQAQDSLMDVFGLLAGSRVHNLPVIEEGRVIGLVSDRDVLRFARYHDDDDFDLPSGLNAEDAMRNLVFVCSENASMRQVAAAMLAGRSDTIAVVDADEHVVGLVTADVLSQNLPGYKH